MQQTDDTIKQSEKVYISGLISGIPIEKAREKFERAAQIILAGGAEPVNPLENGLPETAPWELHMAIDIVLLMGCETIYLLPDWEHSRGATLEKNIAELTGKKLIYEQQPRNEEIKQAITEITGLLFHEIAGPSRKTNAVRARMVYSNACFSISRIKDIAADLKRSTASVHYYLGQYRNEYKFNPSFRKLADMVEERIYQIEK